METWEKKWLSRPLARKRRLTLGLDRSRVTWHWTLAYGGRHWLSHATVSSVPAGDLAGSQ